MQICKTVTFRHKKLLMVVTGTPFSGKPIQQGQFRNVFGQRWVLSVTFMAL
jgi:hypothetical protein